MQQLKKIILASLKREARFNKYQELYNNIDKWEQVNHLIYCLEYNKSIVFNKYQINFLIDSMTNFNKLIIK